MTQYKTIAETQNFIVLDRYDKFYELNDPPAIYQTEASLEKEFIRDLQSQGYEYRPDITRPETLLANAREQIQVLNDVTFTDNEWQRYVE